MCDSERYSTIAQLNCPAQRNNGMDSIINKVMNLHSNYIWKFFHGDIFVSIADVRERERNSISRNMITS